MLDVPIGVQDNSIEGQALFYAYLIKYTGTKTLRFFPCSKTGRRLADQIRLETLKKLFRNYGVCYTTKKREIDALEVYAKKQGYTFEDVDPVDYVPKLYKAEIRAKTIILQK